ncbi:MAG TPA: hypothetical protein VFS21_17795 [Roseiflexaceae bacterium]|nr:hypothetical protein [Roseiflexaceae bacterium]
MRYASLLVLAALLGTIIFGTPGRARAAELPYPQARTTYSPIGLATDGRYVAWAEDETPSRHSRYTRLRVALIDGDQLRPISIDIRLPFLAFNRPGFALDNARLVYLTPTESGPASGLTALNLDTSETRAVADAPAVQPTLAGDTLSWWEMDEDQKIGHLKSRNLRTMDAPIEIAQQPFDRSYNVRTPHSSAGWVVWAQARYDNGEGNPPCWTLYAVQAAGGTPRAVDRFDCGTGEVEFALSGDTLIYAKTTLLHWTDLRSGSTSISGPHGFQDLALDRGFAFWLKNSGLWGYDAASDSAFAIAPYTEFQMVAARNGTLTWVEHRGGTNFFIRSAPIRRALPDGPHSPGDPLLIGKAFFDTTGHGVGGAFLSYWNRNGALPVFGYPLTEEFLQKNGSDGKTYAVQYFERQRYEYHPENQGTPYEVLLGRLGAEALEARGVDWQTLPKASPAAPHYYPQTGQAIDPLFWNYWRTHGLELGDPGVSEREALALWGYPLTGLTNEVLPDGTTLKVQWYERARFEYHPGNPEPYKVLLGRLAADRVGSLWGGR